MTRRRCGQGLAAVAAAWLLLLLLLPAQAEHVAPRPFAWRISDGHASERLYPTEVRSIFDSKCLDCHGRAVRFPWYHGTA